MNIIDLLTARYDTLTDLNGRGENAEGYLKRRVHKCCFAAQICVREPGPSLQKMIFADDKDCDDDVKEKQIKLFFK